MLVRFLSLGDLPDHDSALCYHLRFGTTFGGKICSGWVCSSRINRILLSITCNEVRTPIIRIEGSFDVTLIFIVVIFLYSLPFALSHGQSYSPGRRELRGLEVLYFRVMTCSTGRGL